MIIMGIDPGSQRTGFGIIRVEGDEVRHLNHGVIVLSDEGAFPHRMRALSDSLQTILQKHPPQMIVVEKIFLGKNPESAFQLGHARGVVLCEAARSGAHLHEYATRAVKKGVTGNGGASKEEVQTALQKLLRLVKLVNLDASDALALAYFQSQKVLAERRSLRFRTSVKETDQGGRL
jgi:crossover junction endodeoxyribonuclease RuvC